MSTDGATGRVWTLTILAPCEWLLANRNSAHQRYTRSKLTRQWRQAIVDCCRSGRLPCGDNRLERIAVDAVARFRGRAPVRDSGNLRPTLKACVDGFTPERFLNRQGKRVHIPGYGLIPDDSDKHVADDRIRIGEPLPSTVIADHPGLLVITIFELAPVNSLF